MKGEVPATIVKVISCSYRKWSARTRACNQTVMSAGTKVRIVGFVVFSFAIDSVIMLWLVRLAWSRNLDEIGHLCRFGRLVVWNLLTLYHRVPGSNPGAPITHSLG
jgi:hypothetical protein